MRLVCWAPRIVRGCWGRAAGGGGAVGGQGGSHVVDCFEFQAEEFILDFIANRE